jgi:hypothetical protein
MLFTEADYNKGLKMADNCIERMQKIGAYRKIADL